MQVAILRMPSYSYSFWAELHCFDLLDLISHCQNCGDEVIRVSSKKDLAGSDINSGLWHSCMPRVCRSGVQIPAQQILHSIANGLPPFLFLTVRKDVQATGTHFLHMHTRSRAVAKEHRTRNPAITIRESDALPLH